MGYFTALFARLLRPTRGVHTGPYGYLRELSAEFRRVRSRRVRRYVIPVLEGPRGSGEEITPPVPAPPIPAPRRPADDRPRTALSAAVPVVDPAAVTAPAAPVRGHYRHCEQRTGQQYTGQLCTARQRTDRTRLGTALLWDLTAAQEGIVA